MRIALLHGADAAADPVVAQITAALDASGHVVEPAVLGEDVALVIAALRALAPELVFNLAESFGGKSALESSVAGLLNLLHLRYTGSSPVTLGMAGDKAITKKVLAFHGIRTPEFASVWRGSVDWAGELQFPLIVKPPQEDASIGITSRSVVRDVRELLETMGAVNAAFQQPVLVEQFVEGREFYVGVLGNTQAEALPLVELDFTGFPDGVPHVASWQAKWGTGEAEYEGTRSVFPEALDAELAARIGQVAVDAFHALRLRDYGRVDLRVTDAGEIYVIEVNPNCYLERNGEFARAAARGGIEYDTLIARIAELAGARYAR
ncbi:MAG TPA: ATP-grasp domain-containing protein [Longimicrobiales bacterium]|nr:ATP-grasp domain-containing protein [Longimicrobiales bacterium]